MDNRKLLNVEVEEKVRLKFAEAYPVMASGLTRLISDLDDMVEKHHEWVHIMENSVRSPYWFSQFAETENAWRFYAATLYKAIRNSDFPEGIKMPYRGNCCEEESRQQRPPFKGGVSVCPECEHPLGEFQVCFNCQAQDYEEGM